MMFTSCDLKVVFVYRTYAGIEKINIVSDRHMTKATTYVQHTNIV